MMNRVTKLLAIFLSLIFVISLFFSSITFAATKKSIAIPQRLVASNITTTSISLSWTAVSSASGYKIYRATTNDINYSLVATVSTTTYNDVNLASGTSYWYYVKAYNSFATSADSTHIKVSTLASVVPPAPLPPSTSKKAVLGFTTYYYSGDKSSYNSMVTNTSSLDEIVTATYTTDSYGNLTGLVPTEQITYANNNGIKTFAMIGNNFNGTVAKTLLESSQNRQALINNILSQLNLYGYKGVNIDLEGVFYYDRTYYTAFLSELYSILKPQGFSITVSVPAKTSDSPTNTWSGAYDYSKLATYADKVAIMTYDEHYPGGTPGPIASINWVENVVKYALSVIPKEKILLGTAAYGYDWSSTGTKAYSINGIYKLASDTGSTINWDSVSQSPYFNYTDATGVSHTVWFENETSLSYKLNIVNNYDLNGIAIWRLGLENTAYWTTINSKFNK